MGHSCRTLLWDTPVGHTLRTRLTRLPPKVTLRGCKTSVSYETSSKSHASSLKNERFVRDVLQKSHVKSPKRAFRTRLPPKVTCQVPKTSVSYETSSSKTHMSKSAIRTFRMRLPPKVQRKHPSEHTHHAALPSSFAIPAPPNDARSHANPNVTATFTSTATHNLPIPCACHESFRVHTSNAQSTVPATKCHLRHKSQPHDSLRLPRKSHFHTSKPAQSPAPATKSNNIIACELQRNLHHTIRLE